MTWVFIFGRVSKLRFLVLGFLYLAESRNFAFFFLYSGYSAIEVHDLGFYLWQSLETALTGYLNIQIPYHFN